MVALAASLDTYVPDMSRKAVLDWMLARLDNPRRGEDLSARELAAAAVDAYEGQLDLARALDIAVDAVAEIDFEGAVATW
jgi:hypothetical protein